MTIIKFNSGVGPSFLSNFFPCNVPVTLNGHKVVFPSAEHAYQCVKQLTPTLEQIAPFLSGRAYDAKQDGKLLAIREDWDEIKVSCMEYILRAKFRGLLLPRLLATADLELYHLSPWDRFWGVDSKFEGENRLGILLMELRERERIKRDLQVKEDLANGDARTTG